ncbi:uncharacterized protein Z520_07147 [Fonsecaea multimorphosa CBS 102226]|uniref:Uncharacterized protein n=1 Tax=Fonsecaea multimorphosa CBS 102226 TaxID=1442371 RepID=A0A0D2KK86_9EURO|nr:uncharacterized protein Z520_07147 [Fonsecaea multimorphosa CBS 102226]KIX97033.1 hypothetical protein Z520_07147 [Fonsecaea multimorphosa CBS 102226]
MSSRLLHAPRARSHTGAWPAAFPNVFSKREDLLPKSIIEPPNPCSAPSPPTSGLSDLVDDADVMFSRVSQSCTRKGPLDPEEVTVNDFGRYFPHKQQEAEISDSDFELKEDDDDDDETVQERPSKYNVKPPARPSTQFDAIATPTLSAPQSPRKTPRTPSTPQATPMKTRSSTSTAHSLSKSPFRGWRGSRRTPPAAAPELSPSERAATTIAYDLLDKDSVEDAELPGVPERNLRKRTLQQTNPYKFDKHRHQLSRKTGRAANSKKVEKAVKEEIDVTGKQLTTKKLRVSSGDSAKALTLMKQAPDNRNRSKSVCSVTPSPEIYPGNVFDLARTTLRVRLDGFPGGAATLITLGECEDNDKLIDFILKSWEWKFKGAGFSHAVVSFPWLSKQSNILLRPGLTESFQGMVTEIENAPVWTEGGHARCDIEVTVYLQ